MKFAALLFALPALALAADPSITFIRSFPGSVPDYLCVHVERSGAIQYSEAPKDDQPVKAQLSDADVSSLFDLAAKLDYFKNPLESGLKVANTGKKTFRYDDGNGAVSEEVFNYSTNEVAQQLLTRLEDVGATERAYLDLDRAVHFDKLGVNDALAQIELLWVQRQLAAPQQFFPLLTRIANHEAFMHLVRDRAARLKDEFQAPPSGQKSENKTK